MHRKLVITISTQFHPFPDIPNSIPMAKEMPVMPAVTTKKKNVDGKTLQQEKKYQQD